MINYTTFSFVWRDPIGEYDSFVLKCKIGDSVYEIEYEKNERIGYCTQIPTLAGFYIEYTINVKWNGILFNSTRSRNLICNLIF